MTSFFLPPVLCYHSIDRSGSLISVSPELFESHMNYLSAQGYHVLSMQDGLDRLNQQQAISEKTVVLTFDDGYENNYTVVRPLLTRYGFNATFYVATGFVGATAAWMKRDLCGMFPSLACVPGAPSIRLDHNHALIQSRIPYLLRLSEKDRTDHLNRLLALADHRLMTWSQITQLAKEGFEIGDHSQSHSFLTEIESDDLVIELRASRHILESQIGRRVRNFCYPYGAHDNRVQQVVRDQGYGSACTTVTGVDWRNWCSPFSLRRIMLHDRYSLAHFSEVLSPVQRVVLAVKPIFAGWSTRLGKCFRRGEAQLESAASG